MTFLLKLFEAIGFSRFNRMPLPASLETPRSAAHLSRLEPLDGVPSKG
ncbi:hypothetical protein QUA20_08510 [Microcoleus sp. Pol7_A1]